MLSEGTRTMMVLSMNIIGDSTSHRYEARARRDGKKPTHGDNHHQDFGQKYAGLATQYARCAIKGKQSIKTAHIQ